MSALDPNIYTVAWLAPLPIEAQAALYMLDKRHEGRFPLRRGDDYVFEAGEICGHNVIIATLPAGQEYGTGSGAALASQVKNPPRDIRLGDILVALPEGESPGVVAYDLGKETGTHGFQLLHSGYRPADTEPVVRSAIGSIKLRAPEEADAFIPYYKHIKDKVHAVGTFADPGQETDRLYYVDEDGACQLLERQRRVDSKRTRVWYGPIGSGEKLMRNTEKRNTLRDKYNIIGLEMEAAGVMNRIPVGVIRGVCDYGDENKNKDWQPYAAAMAAAFAKAVLFNIAPKRLQLKKLSPEDGDLLERFLQDICETDPENEKLRIEDDKGGLLKDCFTWILQEPQFLKWQSNQNERLLWIRGEPGKGKTMLMIGLIDVFTTQLNGSDSLSYFFLQNSAPHLNNGVSVLRGLIWKLLFAHPQLHRYIPDEYRSKNKDMGMDMFRRPDAFSTLKKMLSCMLRDPSLETVYIFVDALDECDHDLNKLVQWIASDTSEPLSKAKWLLSSRRIPIIQETFLSEDQQHAILELPETHISQAVRRFIQLNVKRLAKMKSYDDELRRNVEASLAKGAESTFLWVYLVCNSLETIPRRRTLSELKKFPSGLTPLYDRMLQQIERQDEDDRELCKQILRAVTICYRPLSLEELSSLAGLHDAAVDDSRDLADLCGSLLILRDQSIYLVHHTAKEYLVAALYVEDHSVILSRSLYAMSNILQKNIYNLRGAGTSIDRIKLTGPDPLAPVRYACFYWIDHLCQIDRNLDSQVGLCDGGDIDLFLRENILYWLEALSLMKGMSNAVAMIKKLQNALSVTLSTTQTPGLETFVYDAERFVLTNMSIVERAPLQLYSSALIFSPTVSIIRDKFWAHLPSWVDHVPAVENIWSAFLQVLEHPDCVTAIAFLNGRLVTSTLFDPVVRVWNPSTGALVWKFEFDTWWLLAAFSPENTIASVYYIGTLIRIRDISTGALKRVIYTHYKVSVLSFSLDGKILAAGCVNGSIEIWNPSSGSRKMVLHGHTEFIRAISFSPGSGFLASAADDWTVRVWDISSGSSVQVLKHQYCPSAVAFSPDSKYIASGTMGGCIRIWDSSTRELLSVCKGHSGIVTAVVFSPTNSEIIASGSYDKTVRLWDISTGSTGSLVDTFTGHGDIVRVVSFSPDGMLASGSSDRTVRLWDIERMPIPTVAQEWDFHIIDEMVFSPDGKLVASRSGTKKVRLWNTYGECVGRLDSLDSGTFQFSPDGKRIAVIPSQGRNSIQLFDIEEDTTTQLLERPSLVFSALAFSPDGKSLAYDASSCFLHVHYCTINLWNLSTGECTCVVERQPLRISVLAFSPNGDILASGSRDGSNRAVISLWNLQTGEAIKCVATTHPTRWMSFANDGQSLETDQGVIEVESVSSSGIQHGPLRPPNLSVCGDWVAWKGECRLWLPSDYRPVCWVAKGNKLALALHTGRVVCLGLRESDK